MDKKFKVNFLTASKNLHFASQDALLIFWSKKSPDLDLHHLNLENNLRAAAAELGFDIALSEKAKDDGQENS